MQATIEITLVNMTCWCGTPFAMPKRLYDAALSNSTTSFHCPHGHANVFRESEADKLRKQLSQTAKQIEELETNVRWYKDARDDAEKRCSAQKVQVTKLKKRIAGGACPCCNRWFSNLHAHMTGQHPDFAKTDDAPK